MQSRYAEVYSAHFKIDAKFSGLRYIMYHYPTTAAISGSSLTMFILAGILILSWYRFFAQPVSTLEPEQEEFKDPFESIDDIGKESNILGENVENIEEEKVEKEEEEKKDEDPFEDFGLPDFTSHKDLW